MVVIEIPPNPNCEPVDTRVFHDVEPPRAIQHPQRGRHAGVPQWYDVTGWTTAGAPCPALIQKVDDSGEGVAWLVRGGDAGLRFRPAGAREPWQLDGAQQ